MARAIYWLTSLLLVGCFAPSTSRQPHRQLDKEPTCDQYHEKLVPLEEVPLSDDERREARSSRRQRFERSQNRKRSRSPHDTQDDQKYFSRGDRTESLYRLRDLVTAYLSSSQSLLATDTTKHIADGLVRASRSIVYGFVFSAASLVGIPSLGFQWRGNGGLVAGVLIGSVSSTGLVIHSIWNAVKHIVIGSIRTPNALFHWFVTGQRHWHCSVFNTAQHEAGQSHTERGQCDWIRYDFPREEDQVLKGKEELQRNRLVKDREYYALLEVSSNVSAKEIRKAYHRRAKDLHPDKNPMLQPNPEAKKEHEELFLRLHQAYTILHDDHLRELYDRYGTTSPASSDSSSIFDMDSFVATLFGASKGVAPFVGSLRVGVFANRLADLSRALQSKKKTSSEEVKDGNASTNTVVEAFWALFGGDTVGEQQIREVEIARYLLEVVENPSLTQEDFRVKSSSLATSIFNETDLGSQYLVGIVGAALVEEATKYLGYEAFSPIHFVKDWLYPSIRQFTSGVRYEWTAFRKGSQLFSKVVTAAASSTHVDRNESRADEHGNASNSTSSFQIDGAALTSLLPDIFDLAWTTVEMDVFSTVRAACQRLLVDISTTRVGRRARARRLQDLGQTMKQTAELNTNSSSIRLAPEELTERLDRAYKRALALQ